MSFITRGNASLLDAGATQQSTSNAQTPHFFARPFASLGAGLFAAGAPPQPVTEKSTGEVFPGEFCYLRKHDCPRITGIGYVFSVAASRSGGHCWSTLLLHLGQGTSHRLSWCLWAGRGSSVC